MTDLDLAGEYEPRLRSYDVRVMRDVYPPRIKMHYRLTENGHSVVEGDELVDDMNYLANPAARMIQEPLRYEKAMLSDWFRTRFASKRNVTASR